MRIRKHGVITSLLVIAMAVAGLALLVSFGSASGGGHAVAEAPESEGGSDHVNFEDPFVNGRQLANIQEAQNAVGFAVAAPAVLGSPAAVWVNADEPVRAKQTLVATFHHPTFGTFMVVQLPNLGTTTDLKRIVDNCSPTKPCEADWSLVRLQDGADAVLKIGSREIPYETTGVIWMRGGVAFQLYGPATSFTKEAALTVANIIELKG